MYIQVNTKRDIIYDLDREVEVEYKTFEFTWDGKILKSLDFNWSILAETEEELRKKLQGYFYGTSYKPLEILTK